MTMQRVEPVRQKKHPRNSETVLRDPPPASIFFETSRSRRRAFPQIAFIGRRVVMCAILVGCGFIVTCDGPYPETADPAQDSADYITQLPVVDLHNDRSFFLTARQIPWTACDTTQICATRYEHAQYFFALFRPPPPYSPGRFGLSAAQARRLAGMSHFEYLQIALADLRKQTKLPISTDPNELGVAGSRIFLGIEGAFLLDDRAIPARGAAEAASQKPPESAALQRMIGALRDAGVSYVGLTWSNANAYAGVAGDAQGLTPAGRELVRLLRENGLLIDLSHSSDQTVKDVFALTGGRMPLFFSHSSVRALCDHPRNLSDELLELVRASGGLVGINFHTAYITCSARATRADVLKHVQYIARRYGVGSVALGGDFDGLIQLPEGLGGPPEMYDLARDLQTAGFHREEIEAIFFRNARRVLHASAGTRN